MERHTSRQPAMPVDDRGLVHLPSVSGMPRRQPPPLPSDALIGREHERQLLRDLLLDPETRIVSILGPGGVGKTRLALVAAHAVARDFAHGVLFLRLDRHSGGSLWELIGAHLSLTPPHDASWPEAVIGTLTGQYLLLVLDNCESALDMLDELPALLERCPGITTLTTSRETLRLPGEREVWLSPLPIPEDASSPASTLTDNPAVQLFLLRARQVRPDLDVTPADHTTLGAIIRLLDGLPLAIELTAAYARHLSLDEILVLLREAMPSLSGGPRSLPARQQSLRQLVQWSLDTLPPDVHQAALALSIFPNGFSPADVAAVTGSGTRRQAWDLLLTLADKSLVTRSGTGDLSDARFYMLQTIRSVLRDELESTPDLRAETLERLACTLVAYARQADAGYHGPDGLLWLQRMRDQHDNVQLIVTMAFSNPELLPAALELCGSMFWFWYTQGHYQWALPLTEHLLEAGHGDIPGETRAHAHVTAGWLAHRMAQGERAARHFERARSLFGPSPSRASLLGAIGFAYTLSFDGNDTTATIDELERVIELARTVPNAWHEEAAGHFGIGISFYFSGDLPGARSHIMETIRLGRAHSDGQSIGMSLMYLAHIDRAEGKPAEAFWKLREALPLLMEIGDRATAALLLDVASSVLVSLTACELAMQSLAVGEHLRTTMNIPRAPVEMPDTEATRARIDAWLATLAAGERPATSIDLGETIDRLLQFHPESRASISEGARDTGETTSSAQTVLSPRELEVLHLISTGMTSSEIAAALFLSPHTVKRHMANIREKLGVRSQAAAIAALRDVRGN
jgi:predicted ATPase/DNA-binding CsgD family transcriptional regulator